MNATDAVFWSLDVVPELRSGTAALLILERPPSPERLQAEFRRIVAAVPRFRQRVVDAPLALAPPEWLDDPQFDAAYHVRMISMPPPGGMVELLGALGPLFATPLDRDRPLWEAYCTDRLVDGRGAVFFKMHHCLVDGVGGTQLMSTLFGERREPEDVPVPPPAAGRSPATGARLVRALGHDVREAIAFGAAAARGVVGAGLHPVDTALGLRTALRGAIGMGGELGMVRADSPLHQRRSLSRQLATFDMHLAEIDAVRAHVGATNNDVILTIVAGALHRWHTSRGVDVKALRILMPVNIRRERDAAGGNRIALLAVTLPIGEPNPLRRLRLIQESVGRVKSDRRAVFYPLVAGLVARLPVSLLSVVGRQQTARTNLVCTNVPGPRRTCFFAGQAIERVYAYAPLVGDHPLAIALYSYRDMIHVGLDVDPLAMGDLEHFRDALAESYAEVVAFGREPVQERRPA